MSTPTPAQIAVNNLEETVKLLVSHFEEVHPDFEVLGLLKTIKTTATNVGITEISFFRADIKPRFK